MPYRRATSLLFAALVAGCGASAQRFGEVEGTLTLNGEPGHHVHITFIPDVDQGATGPTSIAETDAQGRFVLKYQPEGGTSWRNGAVVGPHRIVLSDRQLAASATGQGVPIRIAPMYCTAGATKLRWEVKEGKQVIEVKVP